MNKEEKRQLKILKLASLDATDKDLEVIDTIQELEDSVDTRINEVETNLSTKIDTISEELKKKLDEELVYEVDEEKIASNVLAKIPTPKDGNDYVLTDEDKMEIALSIDVPVVEKVIEKTETIIEQPIVTNQITNEIKEVAVTDKPEVIADKLNTLKEVVEPEVIKGYKDLRRIVNENANKLYTGVSETRVRELLAQNPSGSVSPLTTKGDIYGYDTADARIPVGNDGRPLTANSANATGVGYTGDVNIGSDIYIGHALRSDASDGLIIEASNGTDVGILGAGNTSNVAWYGSHNFGTNSTGSNINIYGTDGATLIPALTTGNWVLGTGWTFGTSPDRIIKSSNGTGLLTQTGGTAPTIGTLYKVTITVTGFSAGSFTWTLGARSGGGIISADGTYTYYVEAFNTNRFIVTPTNTSRFTLSAISVQPVTLGTVTAQGNLIGSRVTSPLFESTIPYGTPVDTARMSFYAKDGNAGYPDNNTVWYDWNIDLNGVKYQLMKLYAVDATTWQLGGQFSIAPVYIQSNSGSGNGITIRYSYLNFSQAGNSTWMDIKKADTNSGFNMQTSMTDGATAWGYSFDTLNTFSTAGAVIARFKTGGTIKAYIDKDGTYNGVGFTGTGLITNRLTTKQQQWEYDASNYANITVGSTGGVTFDAVGSGAGFTFSDKVIVSNPVNLKNYTVATLPTGVRGDVAYCTDLLLPTFMGIATGGGAVVGKVFFDGTNWITQ